MNVKDALLTFFLAAIFSIAGFQASAQNQISGQFFLDQDQSGVLNSKDWGLGAIRVYLYEDLNGNGIVDPGEPVIAVSVTDNLGNFQFQDVPPGNYIVAFEQEDLPPEKIMITPESYPVSFTPGAAGSIDDMKFGYQGESTICWGVADNDKASSQSIDQFLLINRFSGVNIYIGEPGTRHLEAIAKMHGGTRLYATDNGTFGYIDLQTGQFIRIGEVGSGNGALGNLGFNDIDGLSFDPATGELWGSVRRGGDDLLIKIDPITGKAIPNAFGPGVDYMVIDAPDPEPGLKIEDIDDIAIDPVTGEIYAIINDSGDRDYLVRIDPVTGAVTIIGRLEIWDMEGLGFTREGNLYGTTGDDSNSKTNSDGLYLIDKNSGQMIKRGNFIVGGDFESVECHDGEPHGDTCSVTVTATGGSFCLSGSVELTATGTGENITNITYKWSSDSSLNDPFVANPMASPSQTTTYVVIAYNEADSNCSATAEAVVEVFTAPEIEAIADSVCEGTCNGTANVSLVTPTKGRYQYVWDNGVEGTQITALCAGTYYVTITDANSCTAVDSAEVTEYGPSEIQAIGDSVCEGACTGTATVNLIKPTKEPYQYIWRNGEQGIQINDLCAGLYYVTIIDPDGCTAQDSTVVTEYPPPENQSWKFTDCKESMLQLPSTEGGSSYSWSPVTRLSARNVRHPITTIKDDITYQVTITWPSGCASVDTVRLNPYKQPSFTLHIPNSFTPNNDGENDLFSYVGVFEGIVWYELQIWNRWGEQIYKTHDLTAYWNGRYENNGEFVKDGAYVYIIKALDDCTKERKNYFFRLGWVMVLKSDS